MANQLYDVWCLAGDDDHEEPIPAHKFVLASGSYLLKNMCEDEDFDEIKPIILYDMNHETLKVFIEFMYVGRFIHPDKLKTHASSLYRTADLYEVPTLRVLCRNQLMSSLNMSNALEIFEVSIDDKILHNKALWYVISNMKVIALTDEFHSFVERNPSLTVELIKVLAIHGPDGTYPK